LTGEQELYQKLIPAVFDTHSPVEIIGSLSVPEALKKGKPIFNETREGLIEKFKIAHAHSPRNLNSHISQELDQLVFTCLAKNKKDRYQNTGALKNDLLRIYQSYKSIT